MHNFWDSPRFSHRYPGANALQLQAGGTRRFKIQTRPKFLTAERDAMGTLRYALLGLLDRQPMTGYELTREFSSALSEFWNARHSQIYPELKRLAAEGLVEFSTEITGTQLERKRYSITLAGKRAFKTWEGASHPLPPTPKDEFKLQLFFSDSLSATGRKRLLQDNLTAHQARLEHLEHNAEAFGTPEDLSDRELNDYLVLQGAIMRERASCTWLEKCLETCR